LLELNAGRARKVAYLDDAGALTFAELADRVRGVAGALRAAGIRREERVFLCLHDTSDFPAAFLGALYAGVVPVAANTLLTVDDYAYMLAHSRAQVLLVSEALLPTFAQALERSAHEVKLVVVARPTAPLADGRVAFEAWLRGAPAATAPAATGCDEMAFWLYSSGSTGRPKGTVHSHGNLYWTQETYGRRVLGLREDDVVFSAAKLFFAYGLGNALTFPLSVGATTVLMAERPTPAAVFRRLTERRPTVFFGVPTLYAAMLAAPDLPAREAVALRRCVSAGEPLPREVGERFAGRFDCEVLDGIGSTEMLHIFVSNHPGAVRYGTTGTPVPGYDIELRGEDGAPVAVGEIGDLYIRGPSAALLYWGDHERTRGTFQGPWTKSGDTYVRGADGFCTYAGRSDDMLKVSGQYVSPFEVEAALMRHDAVWEAAVVGRPDADGLTRTLAYVVLKSGEAGSEALSETLKAFVKDHLAPYKYPREIRFLEELPKTATGKIQRFRLREWGA
jgi:benzoate-CoA ligase